MVKKELIGKALDFNKKIHSLKGKNCYHHVGIYSFRYKTLEKYGTIYGPRIKPLVVGENEISLDIDSPFDFFVCEMILRYWKKFKI